MINRYDAYNVLSSSPVISDRITIKSTNDNPIIIKETENEDYKCIRFVDRNDRQRYLLLFAEGHLKLKSYDANGTIIVDKTLG